MFISKEFIDLLIDFITLKIILELILVVHYFIFLLQNIESPVTGHVYGAVDRWIGLGVFFDSFDNDNKHNNPYIMAMTNDGTKNFDHQNDGSTQQLAGCLRDFRNKPFPVRYMVLPLSRLPAVPLNPPNLQGEDRILQEHPDPALPQRDVEQRQGLRDVRAGGERCAAEERLLRCLRSYRRTR